MKVCIIKLGALGDVIRTTPILQAIKQKHPESEITWITKPESEEILMGNPNINYILKLPIDPTFHNLPFFDILYNFDIEQQATQLADKINAREKFGYYDNDGFPASFNLGAEYYLNTLFDDEFKKSNTKTYQEMIFNTAELPYDRQKPFISISSDARQFANDFLRMNNLQDKKIIGIHVGSSKRWPSKAWHMDKIKEFIKLAKLKQYEILLFGGPNEIESLPKFVNTLSKQGIKVYQNNPYNTINQFASLVNICDKIVTGDTLALHVALALGKPTIALFFCTSPNEIEGYDCLKKLVSPKLLEFFPEKSDLYDEQLVNSISSQNVLDVI